jgi:hypothetical protein
LRKSLGTTDVPHKEKPADAKQDRSVISPQHAMPHALSRRAAATMLYWQIGQLPGDAVGAETDGRSDLLRELMAVFDDLPQSLRDAINYAPESLDPKGLATLCRRHGAANVLAMIELKLQRRARSAAPVEKTG